MLRFFNKKVKIYRAYVDEDSYETVVAKNFEEAQKKLAEKYPDVVFKKINNK